jgi:hypothetical protein
MTVRNEKVIRLFIFLSHLAVLRPAEKRRELSQANQIQFAQGL